MCSSQELTFIQVNESHEAAMNATEEAASRRISTTTRTYFYFTTASLTVCLVFALTTIMVLIVQRKGLTPQEHGVTYPQKEEEKVDGGKFGLTNAKQALQVPFKPEIHLEAVLMTLQNASFKKAAAYMKVQRPLNSPKLTWTKNHILHDITYNSDGDPVIQRPGLYLIYCNLHFHLTNFSGDIIDLKMELLVNNKTYKQTLFTHCFNSNRQTVFQQCASIANPNRIFQELSIFHLMNLDADSWISIKTEQYKYLDFDILPNDSVLAILRYSEECINCSL
ncbi:tumor necrosis factor ligand superfamily member 8 [Carettochelys insculpta]|uniref:tumor necrosis factor ligand superfamily member 8 n=1 Tax=Carettochelys insculpta TaxID=44489 RepID=UPI003EBF19E8